MTLISIAGVLACLDHVCELALEYLLELMLELVPSVGGVEVDTGIGAGGGARCSPLFGSSSPCLCSFLIMFQMILCIVVRIAHLLLLVGAA